MFKYKIKYYKLHMPLHFIVDVFYILLLVAMDEFVGVLLIDALILWHSIVPWQQMKRND